MAEDDNALTGPFWEVHDSYDDSRLSYSVNLMFAGIHLIILDRGVDHAIVSFCVHVYVCVDEQDI